MPSGDTPRNSPQYGGIDSPGGASVQSQVRDAATLCHSYAATHTRCHARVCQDNLAMSDDDDDDDEMRGDMSQLQGLAGSDDDDIVGGSDDENLGGGSPPPEEEDEEGDPLRAAAEAGEEADEGDAPDATMEEAAGEEEEEEEDEAALSDMMYFDEKTKKYHWIPKKDVARDYTKPDDWRGLVVSSDEKLGQLREKTCPASRWPHHLSLIHI